MGLLRSIHAAVSRPRPRLPPAETAPAGAPSATTQPAASRSPRWCRARGRTSASAGPARRSDHIRALCRTRARSAHWPRALPRIVRSNLVAVHFTERIFGMHATLLHGSTAGRSQPPAATFTGGERTPAGQARACGSERSQQWPLSGLKHSALEIPSLPSPNREGVITERY